MSDRAPEEQLESPPQTGNDDIDAALDSVRDLDDIALDDHQDRLSAVHEAVNNALGG